MILSRNLYLSFTNILTVISQSSEVTIPKSFEGKVRGWLGNKDDVFEEAHNQVYQCCFCMKILTVRALPAAKIQISLSIIPVQKTLSYT